jgi:hypothetical protein
MVENGDWEMIGLWSHKNNIQGVRSNVQSTLSRGNHDDAKHAAHQYSKKLHGTGPMSARSNAFVWNSKSLSLER